MLLSGPPTTGGLRQKQTLEMQFLPPMDVNIQSIQIQIQFKRRVVSCQRYTVIGQFQAPKYFFPKIVRPYYKRFLAYYKRFSGA